MLKIWTDFNARDFDGSCWLLRYDGEILESQIDSLGLKPDDIILLYQDDDDFFVEGQLDYKFVEVLQHDAWVAIPDWSTINRRAQPDKQ